MEDLDVKSDSLNSGLEGVYSSTVDQTQVDGYLEKLMATQANDVENMAGGVGIKNLEGSAVVEEEKKEEDDLMARISALQD